jgi:hypothetical protein
MPFISNYPFPKLSMTGYKFRGGFLKSDEWVGSLRFFFSRREHGLDKQVDVGYLGATSVLGLFALFDKWKAAPTDPPSSWRKLYDALSSFAAQLLHGPIGRDRRPAHFTPAFQRYDGRALSKILSNIAETRANQLYGRSKFMRFDLHILRPMMDLKIAREVDHDRRIRDRLLHGRYSKGSTPITAKQNRGSSISVHLCSGRYEERSPLKWLVYHHRPRLCL